MSHKKDARLIWVKSLVYSIGRRDARLRALFTLGPLYYLILGILFMVINTAKIFCSVLTFLDNIGGICNTIKHLYIPY